MVVIAVKMTERREKELFKILQTGGTLCNRGREEPLLPAPQGSAAMDGIPIKTTMWWGRGVRYLIEASSTLAQVLHLNSGTVFKFKFFLLAFWPALKMCSSWPCILLALSSSLCSPWTSLIWGLVWQTKVSSLSLIHAWVGAERWVNPRKAELLILPVNLPAKQPLQPVQSLYSCTAPCCKIQYF